MSKRTEFSITVIKTLFGASPNICAYTGCEEKLTDPGWKEVNAEVAHICGERPSAARFDPSMTDEERNAYDNLLLLCPKHHKLIDRLDPGGHSVDFLREMKAKSALHGVTSSAWAAEKDLVRFALMLATASSTYENSADDAAAPRLEVRRSGKRIVMTNSGRSTAVSILVSEAQPNESPVLIGNVPNSLPPRASFDIGLWVQTMASRSFAELTVTWEDDRGSSFLDTFPIN